MNAYRVTGPLSRLPYGRGPMPLSRLPRATKTDGIDLVEMRPSLWGNGLFTTKKVVPGDVLLSVPRESCLIISFDGKGDEDGGIQVSESQTFFSYHLQLQKPLQLPQPLH